jgi:hypothetical protein
LEEEEEEEEEDYSTGLVKPLLRGADTRHRTAPKEEEEDFMGMKTRQVFFNTIENQKAEEGGGGGDFHSHQLALVVISGLRR